MDILLQLDVHLQIIATFDLGYFIAYCSITFVTFRLAPEKS